MAYLRYYNLKQFLTNSRTQYTVKPLIKNTLTLLQTQCHLSQFGSIYYLEIKTKPTLRPFLSVPDVFLI